MACDEDSHSTFKISNQDLYTGRRRPSTNPTPAPLVILFRQNSTGIDVEKVQIATVTTTKLFPLSNLSSVLFDLYQPRWQMAYRKKTQQQHLLQILLKGNVEIHQ
jgi:hypothetical protein